MPPHKKPPEWTDSDRQHLQEMADERAHRKWLGDLLKRWAIWIAAIAVASRYLWDGLTSIVRSLIQGPP